MNITPIELYWMTRLDSFLSLFFIVFVVLIILAVVNAIGGFVAMDEAYENRVMRYNNNVDVPKDEAKMRMRFSRAAKIGVAACLLGLVASFVPSTKQMAAIIVIPKLANSEVVAEMGDAAKEMVMLARDWMMTLAPSKENQKGETK